MSDYLAVQHPIDPTTVSFDFWAWRVYRRLIIDRLQALAAVETPHNAKLLEHTASRIETEHFDDADWVALRDYLSTHSTREIHTQNDLFEVLVALSTARGATVTNHWYLPSIQADWDSIPIQRPFFAGKVSGVPLRARLVETTQPIPDYSVIWVNPDGSEEPPMPVLGTKIGNNLPYTQAIWDWLFARRLTLLCLAGAANWPDPDAPPIVLSGPWRTPPQPF